jgi:hypothetical protein
MFLSTRQRQPSNMIGASPAGGLWDAVPVAPTHGGSADDTTDATAAIGYVRTSTGKQENGLGAQRDSIDRYAKAHGLRGLAVYEDPATSGASAVAERPGFNAAALALRAVSLDTRWMGKARA